MWAMEITGLGRDEERAARRTEARASGTNPRRSGTAALALAMAFGLGLLADRLLWAGPRGPGLAIWVLLLGGAALVLARRLRAPWIRAVAAWTGVAVAASAAAVLRDLPGTTLAMWLVVLTSGSMVLLRAGDVRLGSTRPFDHFLGLALVPGRAVAGALPLLRDVEVPEEASHRRLAGVVRGAVLALPLFFLFGGLFASADAGFDRYASRLAAIWSEDAIAHVVLTLSFAWISAGLLAGLRVGRLPEPLGGVTPPRFGAEETGTVLGLLVLLFLVFVGLQLGYLFGGRATIEATSGLTVAEYARRGFFELLVVGLVTIGVLLAGDALSTARRLFRVLAGVLVACVLVIFASAAQRLVLYTDAFGLTVDRITAAVVMAWLAVVFVLFAATALRERPSRFSSAAVVAGIVAAFALVAIDPGERAARSNLDRAAEDVRAADVSYLIGLGADAVPVLVSRLDELPAKGRCRVADELLGRWTDSDGSEAEPDDWRSWNAARTAARDAVRDRSSHLRAVAARCE